MTGLERHHPPNVPKTQVACPQNAVSRFLPGPYSLSAINPARPGGRIYGGVSGGAVSTEVLLVDDDADVRRAVGKALGHAGFDVTAVDNGLAALAAIQEHTFGVVVSDIRMDFLDGIRLYHELEAEYPELQDRVVFVSGWADDQEVNAFVHQTGRPLLRKPFEIDRLLDVVRDTAARRIRPSQVYLPFSPEEATRLRRQGRTMGGSLVCPRCRGALSVRSVAGHRPGAGWELLCHDCHRSLAVSLR